MIFKDDKILNIEKSLNVNKTHVCHEMLKIYNLADTKPLIVAFENGFILL